VVTFLLLLLVDCACVTERRWRRRRRWFDGWPRLCCSPAAGHLCRSRCLGL